MSPYSDYVIYVDESGDHSLGTLNPEFPVFVLAFVLFAKQDYLVFLPKVHDLKFRHFGHDSEILHEIEIRRAEGAFKFLVDRSRREVFLAELAQLVQEAPFDLIASSIRKDKLKSRYTTPTNPYTLALLFNLERALGSLERRAQACGRYDPCDRRAARQEGGCRAGARVPEDLRSTAVPEVPPAVRAGLCGQEGQLGWPSAGRSLRPPCCTTCPRAPSAQPRLRCALAQASSEPARESRGLWAQGLSLTPEGPSSWREPQKTKGPGFHRGHDVDRDSPILDLKLSTRYRCPEGRARGAVSLPPPQCRACPVPLTAPAAHTRRSTAGPCGRGSTLRARSLRRGRLRAGGTSRSGTSRRSGGCPGRCR